MIFFTKKCHRIFTTTGMAILASSIYLSDAKAQSLPPRESFLIAQTFGGIEGKVPLSEVPSPVIASVKLVTGAEPKEAQVEMQSDGSILYEIGGQNQQGFKFLVDVTPNGKVIEVDEEVERSSVPEIVIKAIKQWAPNAKIANTWRSTRLGEFVYEIVMDNGFLFEVYIDDKKVTKVTIQPES
ncbi:hypothetical protein [Calothrix rhizosoleniae]|uniref:hypothetical protein n=1 Tax=Calothrix rhizosoleniae TaxID=888997 RepID=UPI000B49D404|nr:hypothetical protein [Calothrix rhizosoleniae]